MADETVLSRPLARPGRLERGGAGGLANGQRSEVPRVAPRFAGRSRCLYPGLEPWLRTVRLRGSPASRSASRNGASHGRPWRNPPCGSDDEHRARPDRHRARYPLTQAATHSAGGATGQKAVPVQEVLAPLEKTATHQEYGLQTLEPACS